VIGFDRNRELVAEATSRKLTNCEFHCCDLRGLPKTGTKADGLWCSFAAAYFTDLSPLLRAWGQNLEAQGWIALTEIDDLFGHRPLSRRTSSLLQAYADDAINAGRYDFRMGRKLEQYLNQSGYVLSRLLTLRTRNSRSMVQLGTKRSTHGGLASTGCPCFASFAAPILPACNRSFWPVWRDRITSQLRG
jgi:hypothetical protein